MHETRRIGRFEVTAILDADIPDEPITDAFPGLPEEALHAARERFPDLYLDDWRWRLRIRAWLIRGDDAPLLVDTGLGGPRSPAQEWTSTTGVLSETLHELGTARDDIGRVVITHAHEDHIGGALDDAGAPMCPNARYVIQRADVAWQRTIEGGTRAVLVALQDAGVLEEIDGEHTLGPGLTLRHAPGHTPGHQVLIAEDGAERAMLSGDAWNHPLQIPMPDGFSGSDEDPAAAADTRRTLLADLDAHPATVVAPTHLVEAFGEVRRDGDAWSWSAL
jgi:glyoxylase-like metal-dependent hydrolase (beta-lactamase superfamily II)